MVRKAGVVVLAMVLFPGAAGAMCGSTNHPVMSTVKQDGTQIGLFITQAEIERTQPWKPEHGEPPLSVSAAYRTIKTWGQQRYSRYDDVSVRDISLKRYGCSLVQDRWYYVFELNPIIDDNELWAVGNWAAVLMDGFVIAPREY